MADFRFHIWDLRFAIGNPEGHAFVPEGSHLDRCFTANKPAGRVLLRLVKPFNVYYTSVKAVSIISPVSQRRNYAKVVF